jgi:hypothetical protein
MDQKGESMRNRLIICGASVLAVLAMSAPASATHSFCPAPSDPSAPGHSEFAQHHVAPLAQTGALGAGGHMPGVHTGMFGCHPEQNRP